MANIIIRDKLSKGETYFDERYPGAYKVCEKLRNRRKQGKPIDGNCVKEFGLAVKEIHSKDK